MESVFGIAFLMIMCVGVVEIGLALYGRNVIAAAAHEGARAAVEADSRAGEQIVRSVIGRAVGGAVRDLEVEVAYRRGPLGRAVEVHVDASLVLRGPISIPIPVSVDASALTPVPPR